MKSINEIKDLKEKKVSELIKECSMFFAFSDKQFEENKTPLQEGDKYVSMVGAGAFMPKSKAPEFMKGLDVIDKWYKAEIKANKARKQNIIYELNNHEAFYTGDIEDTLDTLGSDYTREEVMEVYRKERKKQLINS